jgi:hypothetical protein
MAGPDRGYYHSMDRDYNEDALIPIRDIGISIIATKDAVQPLIAKIREGASKVEIGFLGAGKGSIFSGQITPESIDSEQRRTIREIAKVNKVELSTHATVGTGGFAGFGNRGFDENSRVQNMQEIKRAIEFAADTAQGGAVTIHAQEFARPLFDVDKRADVEFLAHPNEKTEAALYLVDERTGDVVTTVRKNVPINAPVYEKNPDGTLKSDSFGNPIPEYDVKNKKFKLQTLEWKDIEKKTEDWNAGHPDQKLKPEQIYYKELVNARTLQAEGERLWHLQDYDRLLERKKRVEEAMTKWQKLEHMAGKDKEHLMKEFHEEGVPPDLVMPERGLPTERLKIAKDHLDRQLSRIQQSALSYQEQIKDFDDQFQRLKPITEFAVKKSAESIAQLGMFAYNIEKEKKLKKDLFVAPEGIFPETYGSHPQEIKTLVLESRSRMAKLLQDQKGMSPDAAYSEAEKHIKATVDVGHVNVWRKYFQSKPGESIADSDKRFNKWLLSEMDDLNKHKVVGHLHISDNFGYQDEHLTPGMGSAPIKEFVQLMKAAAEKQGKPIDLVVEPGAQDPAKQYEALYGGWKLFGHSIYGLSAPGGKRIDWNTAQHSYFAQNHPPYFLFGEMALSEEYRGSPFWSGLGLE